MSPGSRGMCFFAKTTFASRLRCGSITPLEKPGRPRRVDDRGELLVSDGRELKALGRLLRATRIPSRRQDVGEAPREALLSAMEDVKIRQREDGRDVAQLLRVERREEGVRHEEEDGVGVVHDVMHVVGAEIGKDRDDDGSVRDAGEPDDRPARGVPPEKGDLVAGPDPADPEDLVEPIRSRPRPARTSGSGPPSPSARGASSSAARFRR